MFEHKAKVTKAIVSGWPSDCCDFLSGKIAAPPDDCKTPPDSTTMSLTLKSNSSAVQSLADAGTYWLKNRTGIGDGGNTDCDMTSTYQKSLDPMLEKQHEKVTKAIIGGWPSDCCDFISGKIQTPPDDCKKQPDSFTLSLTLAKLEASAVQNLTLIQSLTLTAAQDLGKFWLTNGTTQIV